MWTFSFKARAEREFGRVPHELQTSIAVKVRKKIAILRVAHRCDVYR